MPGPGWPLRALISEMGINETSALVSMTEVVQVLRKPYRWGNSTEPLS
jgi:hypothetical protein